MPVLESRSEGATLQSARGAMGALAGVNVLNLDNPAAPATHSVDDVRKYSMMG